jgi:sulfatase maturation enzyme AslB (radical SAM superfamily)
MCPRNINGGITNPLIEVTEIKLDTFKAWFSEKFIRQLDSLFMCGNLGDPIMAKDCLSILKYLREVNPNIKLSMHTNSSARNTSFWKELAQAKVRVVFGIDGLADTHSLYRIGTQYSKIISNAQTFIQAGGEAEWHMLVFAHNEHQVGACQHTADQMGFKKFITKHTTRFVNNKFHVIDASGKTTNILLPSAKSKSMIASVKEGCSSTEILCKAVVYKQLYVSANGNVNPCCWLDLSWQLPRQENRIEYMDTVGKFPSLRENTLEEIFKSKHFEKIAKTWNSEPLIECSKQCGKFDKSGEQFK